jgi:hypothetical protein
MKTTVALMTDAELFTFANVVKEGLLKALESEGLITNSEAICADYAVIISRKGWLGRIIDRVWGGDENTIHIRVVKLINVAIPTPPTTREDNNL